MSVVFSLILQSIQMTECQSCIRNVHTINTMLAVMQQQAATVKDQQGTIANLITMLVRLHFLAQINVQNKRRKCR